jgi:hypothetical protein
MKCRKAFIVNNEMLNSFHSIGWLLFYSTVHFIIKKEMIHRFWDSARKSIRYLVGKLKTKLLLYTVLSFCGSNQYSRWYIDTAYMYCRMRVDREFFISLGTLYCTFQKNEYSSAIKNHIFLTFSRIRARGRNSLTFLQNIFTLCFEQIGKSLNALSFLLKIKNASQNILQNFFVFEVFFSNFIFYVIW